jgi:hypothetical protein
VYRVARHLRSNAVGYLALVVALGGTSAIAATTLVGPDGQVNGCVKKAGKGKGTLRVVPPGRRCKRSERAIAFSQRGPEGEDGADGAPGAQGATGATGATGPAGSPDTPSQVLEKLKQVDGDGSALDSDLLDGHETAFFQRRGSTTDCTGAEKVTGIQASGDVSCAADDTAPTGTAGGDLAGTYPNPTIGVKPYVRREGTEEAATCDAGAQVIPHNTATSIRFGATLGAAQGGFDGSACSATGISLPRAGVYAISASMLWAPDADGVRSIILRASTENIAVSRNGPAASGETHQSVAAVYRGAAGENIDVRVIQTSNDPLTSAPSGDGRTHLALTWIGP